MIPVAKRYFIQMAYSGRNYHGWQLQPNAITVQQAMENSLSSLLDCDIRITGAGRTDTGVNASKFVAHFDLDHKIDVTSGAFLRKLNSLLDDDISIHKIFRVNVESHARFSAEKRTYVYVITNGKNPFLRSNAWRFPGELNIDMMKEACRVIVGEHDFTSFSKLHTNVSNNICMIYHADWVANDGLMLFKITANRFLRDMVRSLTGTMTDVGRSKMSLLDFSGVLNARKREAASMSVPAHALFLTEIEYPSWVYKFSG